MSHVQLAEKEILIPASPGHRDMIDHIRKVMESRHEDIAVPIRFAITRMDETGYQCEFGTLEGLTADG